MIMGGWITIVVAIIALFVGFWIGRSMKWMAEETEARVREAEKKGMSGNNDVFRKGRAGTLPMEWVIASPVSGKISSSYEESKCGVSIFPEQEYLYAPVAGRVKKIYPMGNSILISADFGVEIMLSVGKNVDELCNGYYRPRVMQSEIIPKGKLLLEFDKESLEKEGVDITVEVSVEQMWNEKSIVVTQCERIKAGEALLWV